MLGTKELLSTERFFIVQSIVHLFSIIVPASDVALVIGIQGLKMPVFVEDPPGFSDPQYNTITGRRSDLVASPDGLTATVAVAGVDVSFPFHFLLAFSSKRSHGWPKSEAR